MHVEWGRPGWHSSSSSRCWHVACQAPLHVVCPCVMCCCAAGLTTLVPPASPQEKQQREEDEAKRREQQLVLKEQHTARVQSWRNKHKNNIRGLLGSLHTVLWEDSGWKQASMADLLEPQQVWVGCVGVGMCSGAQASASAQLLRLCNDQLQHVCINS
jgi:hypothetical protein